jgi:hypothetical protein
MIFYVNACQDAIKRNAFRGGLQAEQRAGFHTAILQCLQDMGMIVGTTFVF